MTRILADFFSNVTVPIHDDGSDEGFIVEGIMVGIMEGIIVGIMVGIKLIEGIVVGIKLIEGIIVGSWVHMYVGKKLGASEYPPV